MIAWRRDRPSRVTPSVQRLLDRLANTPVVVYDATWTLILANTPYDALMGETSTWRGIERNAIWRDLVGPAPASSTPRKNRPTTRRDLSPTCV